MTSTSLDSPTGFPSENRVSILPGLFTKTPVDIVLCIAGFLDSVSAVAFLLSCTELKRLLSFQHLPRVVLEGALGGGITDFRKRRN
jgi:hypothetical protein